MRIYCDSISFIDARIVHRRGNAIVSYSSVAGDVHSVSLSGIEQEGANVISLATDQAVPEPHISGA